MENFIPTIMVWDLGIATFLCSNASQIHFSVFITLIFVKYTNKYVKFMYIS